MLEGSCSVICVRCSMGWERSRLEKAWGLAAENCRIRMKKGLYGSKLQKPGGGVLFAMRTELSLSGPYSCSKDLAGLLPTTDRKLQDYGITGCATLFILQSI